jgi:hypothetical protein
VGRGKEYKKAAKVPPAPKKICPVCRRQFILQGSLNHHLKKDHGGK